MRFSSGFMLSQPGEEMGPNPRAFGHPGAGGSLGFADPEAKIGFGYAMNRMGGGNAARPARQGAHRRSVFELAHKDRDKKSLHAAASRLALEKAA